MGERQADKIEALQARVAELEGRLRERDAELAQLRELAPFTGGRASVVALRVVGREAPTIEPPHVVDPLGRTLGPDPAMVATEDEAPAP